MSLRPATAKHQMRRSHADKCTQYLGDDIRWSIAPANPALRGISKGYRRIAALFDVKGIFDSRSLTGRE